MFLLCSFLFPNIGIMNAPFTIAATPPDEALPPEALPYSALRDRPRKGRGALSNRAGRFEAFGRERIDDGWGQPLPAKKPAPDPLDDGIDPFAGPGADDPLPPLRTTVTIDTSRTVIARNTSPDIGFDRSINPYRGCEHGCVYCFARPSHAFLGLSPGLDFETRLFAKPDAAALLRRELAKPGYVPKTIAMGTNTDPYQPVERDMRITRQILEVLAEHRHPVSIVTKSALVTRDIDILAPMAAEGLASVALSVTSCDAALARALEPRASSPAKRLDAIRQLSRAGIPTGVMVAPVIPGLTDHELEAILIRAHEAGATRAGYILLRLPRELQGLFDEWLDVHAPDRKRRILRQIRETRGGDLYQSDFGTRMRGTGPAAELLETRFRLSCKRLGFAADGRSSHRRALDTTQFRRPGRPEGAVSPAGAPAAAPKPATRQLDLFA
jgi:DNA repair photolyase